MASLTLNIPDEFKTMIDKLPWVNWSEVVREEILAEEKMSEAFKRFRALASKSKLSKADAKALAEKVDKGMLRELKKKFPRL